MICAYGPYSASATGGNGWARDFLAGVLTVPATPFYMNIGSRPLEYAGTILASISVALVSAVYIIYTKGPYLRKRSPFAQNLASAETTDPLGHRHISALVPAGGHGGETYGRGHGEGHGIAMDNIVRPPNPQIVVTEAVDSRPNTRGGQEEGQYNQYTYNGDVADEDIECRTGLSGETEVDETDERNRYGTGAHS